MYDPLIARIYSCCRKVEGKHLKKTTCKLTKDHRRFKTIHHVDNKFNKIIIIIGIMTILFSQTKKKKKNHDQTPHKPTFLFLLFFFLLLLLLERRWGRESSGTVCMTSLANRRDESCTLINAITFLRHAMELYASVHEV